MALRINTNITAINAHRNLLETDLQLSRSIERLSSGLRVVRASDDPAAFVQSERLRTTIESVGTAVRNITDAVSMVQTTESIFDQVESLLRTMRSLAMHAANTGPNDTAAIEADQAQIIDALNALDQIATTRRFGAKVLLDGSNGKSGNSGSNRVEFIRAGFNTTNDASLPGDYQIVVSVTASATKSCLAAAASFGSSGVSLAQQETLIINGVKITLASGMTIGEAVIKINNQTNFTAVSAGTSGGGSLVLKSTGYGGDYTITVQSDLSNSTDSTSGLGGSNFTTTGLNVQGNLYAMDQTAGTTLQFAVDTNGQFISAGKTTRTTQGVNINLDGLVVRASINAATFTTINVFESQLNFQIAENRSDNIGRGVNSARPEDLGTTGKLKDIDVRSAVGAQRAMTIVDEALTQVLTERGQLGAFQRQFLEPFQSNLRVYQENLQAAESNIRDADLAFEMINFTKRQILLQSGTAMLAQANLSPQSVLQLLR